MPPARGNGLAETLMEALVLIISSPIAPALDIGLAEAEALDIRLALADAEGIVLAPADAPDMGLLIMSSSICATAAGANTSVSDTPCEPSSSKPSSGGPKQR
jgi:hypothetical protein